MIVLKNLTAKLLVVNATEKPGKYYKLKLVPGMEQTLQKDLWGKFTDKKGSILCPFLARLVENGSVKVEHVKPKKSKKAKEDESEKSKKAKEDELENYELVDNSVDELE